MSAAEGDLTSVDNFLQNMQLAGSPGHEHGSPEHGKTASPKPSHDAEHGKTASPKPSHAAEHGKTASPNRDTGHDAEHGKATKHGTKHGAHETAAHAKSSSLIKHGAHEKAAHGHGKSAHHNAHHHHGPANDAERDTFALVILLTIISIAVITVLFENLQHTLIHHARAFRPVVNAVFSELTVSGFMALVAFCFSEVKMIGDHSVLAELSLHIFESDKAGLIIPHAFHEIHMVIFMNMFFFLVSVLGGLAYIIHKTSNFRKFEEEALEFELKKRTPSQGVVQQAAVCSSPSTEEYFHVRERFIEANGLNWDFDFQKYLTKKVGETVAEMVEVPWVSWFVVSLIGCAIWTIRGLVPVSARENAPIISIIVCEWLLLVVSVLLSIYLGRLLQKLLPHPVVAPLDMLEESLKPTQGWAVPEYLRGYEQTTPFLAAHNRAFGSSHMIHTLAHVLTTTLVLSVAYISSHIVAVTPALLKFDDITKIFLLIIAWAPVPAVQVMLFSNAEKFALALCIEAHTDEPLVRKMVRTKKAQQAIRNLHVLTTLKAAINALSGARTQEGEDHITIQKTPSARRRHELQELFTLIDTDKGGEVSKDELRTFLNLVGGDEKDVEAIVSRMQQVANCDSVKFDDFARVLGSFESDDLDPCDPVFIDSLFDMFDKDKSGNLSMEEVLQQLTSLGAWNTKEVTQLFLTIDTDDSGEVSKHEFAEFVHHMFHEERH
jgi:Ca2+-binding EF-hand superfamily protein